jgi:hypothetical protein
VSLGEVPSREDGGKAMTPEEIKSRLSKIGKTPSGSIPPEKLKEVSQRVLPHMELFCSDLFPNGRFSTSGKYWEVPKVFVKVRSEGKVHTLKYNLRISLAMGGFYDWDDPSCRYACGNPLLLWMINQNVVLNDQWHCVSRVDLARSVQELNDWVDNVEKSGQVFIQPKEDPAEISALREIVSLAVESGKPLSAKKIWDLVVEKCGKEECKAIPQLSSHYRLYRLLKDWVKQDDGDEQPEFFSITEKTVSRKTTFTFSASPE